MRVSVLTPMALAALILSGAAQADTLQEALALAYQTNPSLTGARASLRATDEGVPIALAAGRPTISATADYQEFLVRSANSFAAPLRAANAGGNVSFPIFQGGLVRNELLRAAEQKITKGKHFSEMLYIPEPFQAAKKYEIARRRREITARAQQHTKQLGMIIGEVKSFDVSINGERAVIKHLPDWNLFLNNVLARRLRSNFEREIELVAQNMGSHLIICATFEMSRADYPHVCELTLMPVNEHWIPYEASEDLALVDQCIEEGRHFIKGMRMNLAHDSPIAAVILTDTTPMSTALYHTNARASADEMSVLAERMAFKGSSHRIITPGDRLPGDRHARISR